MQNYQQGSSFFRKFAAAIAVAFTATNEDGMVDGPGVTQVTADLATRLRPRTIGLNLRFDW